jgi:hypothetical protein
VLQATPKTPPDWLMRELRDGLQKLLCLSLDGQPSADVIAGTLLAWAEVLTAGRVFEQERDTPRFRAAFRTLASRARRWPAPVDFIEALPRIETPRHGPRLESDKAREMRMSSIAEISARLGINRENAA